MLKEVSDSAVGGGLMPAAHIDPHTDGGGLGAVVLAGHAQAVLQHCHLGLRDVQQRLRERQRVTGSLGCQEADGRADLGARKRATGGERRCLPKI